MTPSMILIEILACVLLTAAIFDLASFTIPNLLTVSMFFLFACFLTTMSLVGHPLSWSQLWPHLLAGTVALFIGMGMFGAGWIGGGDAKLFAMVCLWLGWESIFEYAILASLFGGALTFVILLLRRIPLPRFVISQPWIARLADNEGGVPYGVALAAAALVILPETEVFHLAAIS
jgi:prepilin peptidase CpaA